MPRQIQQIDTPEALRTEFGIKGGLPGMSVDEVIVPVAIVAQLGKPKERTTETDIWGTDQQAASVGQVSMVGVWNPTNSGKLVTVERIRTSSDSDGGLSVKRYDYAQIVAAGWTLSPTINRDSRVGGLNFGPPYPSTVMGRANDAVSPGVGVQSFATLADISVDLELGAVLIPGAGIFVTRAATNVKITLAFIGSERPLRDSGN